MDDKVAIAVVGLGCRFPGADNAEEFWRVLVNCENHVKDIPKDRWNNETFYNKDKNAVGKSYVTKAGFLKDHDMWDNKLFGVSDVEAARIDPQQRYVLECVHMAMEDGGFTRAKMSGTKTGVYIGCMNDDYKIMSMQDSSGNTNYSATGSSTTVISSRVSYVFNLQGPCLTVDTACSSAMMAIHLGCQAIRSGDCCQAICGGVSSIMYPDMFITLSKARMMSAVGQCQTFCDTADGYARGEGCGVVILKPLKQAQLDNDKIWGVIVTGTNQDGRAAQPMTAPSGSQQQALFKHVYTKYDIDPSTIQYIEAHGTGTPIGDPTETNALGSFFSECRSQKANPLLIGSVKTNIGHTESAAGVAGLIKVLLMMKEGKFVPSLHLQRDKGNINKGIDLEKLNIDIPVDVSEWKANEMGQRVACVNSFGFGGSNCHAVVKSSEMHGSNCSRADTTPLLFGISGIDRKSLEMNLEVFIKDISERKVDLQDVSYTSLIRRDHFLHRTIVAGSTVEEIKKDAHRKITMPPQRKHTNINIVFVFCGVGTTWTGMGCQFMTNLKFRKTVQEIDEFLQPLADLRLSDLFSSQETQYDDPFLNHVAIFAVQVALANVWIGFGVEPDVIIGQSVGEVAAAHISGRIELEEAVRIIVHRSKILAKHQNGSMMVVKGVDMNVLETICSQYINTSIAVYSSPVGCTLSGDSSEIEVIKTRLEKYKATETNTNILIRKLGVASAYHSPLVESCREEIIEAIGKIQHRQKIKYNIISTVTAEVASETDFTTGEYWAKNVRQSVLFYQSVKRAASNTKHNIFLEIGPKPVLKAHLADIFEEGSFNCQQSMNFNKEFQCMFDSLSNLFQTGVELNLMNLFSGWRNPISIPKYNFQKSKTLHVSEKMKQYVEGIKSDGNTSHMFMTSMLNGTQSKFEAHLSNSRTPFVFDHRMSGTILVPGATYIDAALFVGMKVLGKSAFSLSVSVDFVNPVTLQPNDESILDISTSIEQKSTVHFRCQNKLGVVVAKGKVFPRETKETKHVQLQSLFNKCQKVKDKSSVYQALRGLQFEYGPSLALIEKSWCSATECISEIFIPANIAREIQNTIIHPAIVDAMFQTFANFINENIDIALPKGSERITLFGPIDPEQRMLYVYVKLVSQTYNEFHFNLVLVNPAGFVLLEILDFYTRTLDESTKYKHTYVVGNTSLDVSRTTERRGGMFYSAKPLDNKTWFSKFVETQGILCIEEAESAIEQQSNLKPLAALFYVNQPVVAQDNLSYSAARGFFRFREFLGWCQKNELQCPIYVITDNTQDHFYKTQTCVNVEGSHMWGMVRALRHEKVHLDLRLVDVDKNDLDLDTLITVFRLMDSANAELIVSGTSVYHISISRFHLNNIGRTREISKDLESSACFLSKSLERVKKPFLADTKIRDAPAHDLNASRVAITSMCLHPLTTFSQTTGIDIPEIWPDIILQSHNVIALEGKGLLKETDSGDIEIGFLYPVPVQYPIVHIPKECTWPLSKYSPTPGVLLHAILLDQIIQNIQDGSRVLLFGNSTMNGQCVKEVFVQMSATKSCEIEFVDIKSVKHIQSSKVGITIVPLVRFSSIDIDKVIIKCKNKTSIVALSGNVSVNLQAYIRMTYPTVAVVVVSPADIFVSQGLRKCVQSTLQNISRNGLESNTNIANMFETSVVQTLDIQLDANIPHKVEMSSLFRKCGCYIVVGGLTGLGRVLVKHIAESGAGHIAIFSRRQPGAEQIQYFKDLETGCSCTIHTLQVDVTDLESLYLARKSLCFALNGVPIRGIFQGAGVLVDAVYENQTEETLVKVLKPKLDGTWNLHVSFKDLPLDYFVMHSSVTSLLGNHGQTNYAAANSFLDSMALYRRSQGMSGQSINWGALAVGMSVEDEKVANKLQNLGIGILSEEKTKEYFTDALLCNETNICFADLNWEVLSHSSAVKEEKVKFSGLLKSGVTDAVKLHNQEEKNRLHQIRNLTLRGKRSAVRKIILSIISEQFVSDTTKLEDDQTFFDLGVDSLSATGFLNSLRTIFSVQYPVVKIMSGSSTIRDVVDFCFERLEVSETQENHFTENYSEESIGKPAVTQIPDLMSYRHFKYDPGLTYMTDIEIRGTALTIENFKNYIAHLLSRFRELRCHIKEEGYDNYVVVEDAALNIIPLEIVPFNQMLDKFTEARDQRDTITFDLDTQYPIKFQIGQTSSCTLVRLSVHKVVSDMTSILLIFKEMKTYLDSLQQNKSIDAHFSEIHPRKAINETLRAKRKACLNYWKQRIEFATPCSLTKEVSEPQAKFFRSTSKTIGPNNYNEILAFLRDSDATLFQLFASVYQLLLAVETGQPNVTILTDIDLRAEIPAIANEVVRGINVIPISAQPSNDMTFSEFLEENKKQMIADIEHGQLPYIDIVNLLQPENKASFGRHYLIINDLTKLDMIASGTPDYPYTVSIKNIWLAKLSKETICQVVYNKTKQSITVHFHYNERICGVERGRHLGEKLFQILHHGIRNRHQTIGTVLHKTDCFHGPKQLTQPDISDKSHSYPAEKIELSSPNKYRPRTHLNVQPMEIINGYFQKQTKAGWSHRVYVTLLEHQDTDNDAKWITIQWCKKPGRPTKSLSVSTCDSISMLNLNRQHSIVVQARDRQLVICTPEHEVAQRWMTVLENCAKRPTIL
ncbi:phenolphthiocerol synthesis polyketide synthase type I Pks15/1-like isoform X1 [Mya arenaria]|uniref:phenolphthiocerol synthesis polyketide synthase type I Pks15/1-like isoform X1 n=1 Tax=Mya arenaria TaxID=6604 RepID=UPI0022E3EC1E|nr:phenolphthiocerol synthesis polyketide synthase type I Pks15/1-like isoform X1 [Mya arenaria]